MQPQQKQTHEDQEQSAPALTPELVKQLEQLLGNNMVQVRHGTLSAILQYTPTRQSKLMFLGTSLMTLLRKYTFEPQLTKLSLSTLIHFATEPQFAPQYLKLVQPLVLKMKEWKDLELELSLLLLLNLSKEEQIQAKILGEEDKKGYLMQILYALLQKKDKNLWIVVGIFVNISSQERGRRFLVQQNLGVRFVSFLNAHDQKLRQGSLKIVRNCSFQYQYQPFATELLKIDHKLFPSLVKLLTFLIYKQQLIHDLTHTNLLLKKLIPQEVMGEWKYFRSSSKEKALGELELGIDIFLVLSNCNLKEKELGIDQAHLKELLTLLKFTEIKEETKDKLEALEIFAL